VHVALEPDLVTPGRAAFRFTLPLFERYYARHHTYRLTSAFAAERLRAVRAELERGATVYLAGIAGGGPHNSGVALVEASRERGTRLICNHEDKSVECIAGVFGRVLNARESLARRHDGGHGEW
jgi:hypothetical protein